MYVGGDRTVADTCILQFAIENTSDLKIRPESGCGFSPHSERKNLSLIDAIFRVRKFSGVVIIIYNTNRNFSHSKCKINISTYE